MIGDYNNLYTTNTYIVQVRYNKDSNGINGDPHLWFFPEVGIPEGFGFEGIVIEKLNDLARVANGKLVGEGTSTIEGYTPENNTDHEKYSLYVNENLVHSLFNEIKTKNAQTSSGDITIWTKDLLETLDQYIFAVEKSPEISRGYQGSLIKI